MQEFTSTNLASLVDQLIPGETFGTQTLEILQMQDRIETTDLEFTLHNRFDCCPAYLDKNYPGYNMNLLPNGRTILGQGPDGGEDNSETLDFERLMQNSIFHPEEDRKINNILSLGRPIESDGNKFFNYIACMDGSQDTLITSKAHYHFNSQQVLAEDSVILQYEVQITKTCVETQQQQAAKINYFTIPNWVDMHGFCFAKNDLCVLQKLFTSREKKLIHCSAGLGRSGTIALAEALYTDYTNIFSGHEFAIAKKIKQVLTELRTHRPGLVQSIDQLTTAIQLATEIYNLKLKNELELDAVESTQKGFKFANS